MCSTENKIISPYFAIQVASNRITWHAKLPREEKLYQTVPILRRISFWLLGIIAGLTYIQPNYELIWVFILTILFPLLFSMIQIANYFAKLNVRDQFFRNIGILVDERGESMGSVAQHYEKPKFNTLYLIGVLTALISIIFVREKIVYPHIEFKRSINLLLFLPILEYFLGRNITELVGILRWDAWGDIDLNAEKVILKGYNYFRYREEIPLKEINEIALVSINTLNREQVTLYINSHGMKFLGASFFTQEYEELPRKPLQVRIYHALTTQLDTMLPIKVYSNLKGLQQYFTGRVVY